MIAVTHQSDHSLLLMHVIQTILQHVYFEQHLTLHNIKWQLLGNNRLCSIDGISHDSNKLCGIDGISLDSNKLCYICGISHDNNTLCSTDGISHDSNNICSIDSISHDSNKIYSIESTQLGDNQLCMKQMEHHQTRDYVECGKHITCAQFGTVH